MTDELTRIRRRVRAVTIIDAAEAAAMSPIALPTLHAIAYFADALLPVWGLRVGEARLLKRAGGPLSPGFQGDIDALVGEGVLFATSVRHVGDGDGEWRLDAEYRLNRAFADPVLDAIAEHPEQQEIAGAIKEVVLALSSIGIDSALSVTDTDATYGDALVSVGDLIELEPPSGIANPSTRVALRFSALAPDDHRLRPAEMAHLYVRELYRRVLNAA